MNAAREARQHGRRGAASPARLQALSHGKVLQSDTSSGETSSC